MSDSQCQLKMIELQLLLKALLNTRSTREGIRDAGAKKASLMKFCKGCTHQNVFGCQVGVLPAVPPDRREGEPSPYTDRRMPHTYTLYAFAPVCKDRHRHLRFHGQPQHVS